MIAARRSFAPLLLFAAVAATFCAAALLIVRSPAFAARPDTLAAALTFDFLISFPIGYYLVVVRRGAAPALSLVPVVLLGCALGFVLLPQDQQQYLRVARTALVPLEGLVLGWAAWRVARQVRRARDAGSGGEDPVDRLARSVAGVLPSRAAATAVAHEAAMLYYALFSWRAAPEVPRDALAFSYHRRTGFGGVAFALATATVVEGVGIHLLVQGWSERAAWALTALSAYGLLWLVGFHRSVVLRPVLVTPQVLRVRLGLRWRMEIPRGEIAAVRVGRGGGENGGTLRAALPGGGPNVCIELRAPREAEGLYGLRRRGVERVALQVDDPAALAAALEAPA